MQVKAGSPATVTLTPENHNHASQFVDGRWVVSLFEARDYLDLSAVTGEVLTESGGPKLPAAGQNVAGEACTATDIVFHGPDMVACAAAEDASDPGCMAWWELPDACQPPNGWGHPLNCDGTIDALDFPPIVDSLLFALGFPESADSDGDGILNGCDPSPHGGPPE